MPRRFSIAQQIEEVERELKLREGVYARSVASGAMRASVAEFHIDRLRAVLATLRWVSEHEGVLRKAIAPLEQQGPQPCG